MLNGIFCKVCEREEKDFNVVDVAHCTLMVMHALEIAFRIICQNGLDHLRHVAEFFKGDAQPVNGGRPGPIQLAPELGHL